MAEQTVLNIVNLNQRNEIFIDILEKLQDFECQITREPYLDIMIKIDEGSVKYITVTGKRIYPKRKRK